MKLSLLLTSIIAIFVGTSLSIRINAPARHFHRRAIERPPTTQRPPSEQHQEFIERHEKFTETLSQVAATIQEAQDGLAEMEMIEAGSVTAGSDNPDVMSRLSQGPGSEEMVDASEQPQSRGVTDVENEGTCRHPKDVNCKSTEDDLTSDLVSHFEILYLLFDNSSLTVRIALLNCQISLSYIMICSCYSLY